MTENRSLFSVDWTALDPWHEYPLEKVQTTEAKAYIQALRAIAEELHWLREDDQKRKGDK